MSEIKVDTLTGKTTANDITVTVGASATMSLEQGLAKAFCNVDATGFTVLESFNASSVVDNSTGNHRLNFSSGMADSNFFSFGGQVSASGTNIRTSGPNNGGNRASAYQNFECYQQGTGNVDKENVGCGVLGDLA